MRKIIHIDMDAFFASIEQRDNAAYRGKPLAVGYAGARGVVAAASYEARKYGVRSAMSSKVALRKCPFLIFVPPRFDVYEEVSRQLMDVFGEYTDLVEPLSLDEAFLDVTDTQLEAKSATEMAQEIKQKIQERTGLTASAGVSYNKFLAKIASDFNKPNGLFLVRPKDGERFVEGLEIERFFGVGKVTAEKMHQLGISNGMDLKQFSEQQLVFHFGKVGHIYYLNARGLDDRPVESRQIRKSIGAETTFEYDMDDIDALCIEMDTVAKDVIERISERNFLGRTVTLKIKYGDFTTISRSKTHSAPVTDYATLYDAGFELLSNLDLTPKVRLLGLTIKNNEKASSWGDAVQLRLEFEEYDDEK